MALPVTSLQAFITTEGTDPDPTPQQISTSFPIRYVLSNTTLDYQLNLTHWPLCQFFARILKAIVHLFQKVFKVRLEFMHRLQTSPLQ